MSQRAKKHLMRLTKQSTVLPHDSTLLGDKHGDPSFSPRSPRSSRPVLELLDRVGHFIDDHFVHSEIHATLHEGGTNQNVDAA